MKNENKTVILFLAGLILIVFAFVLWKIPYFNLLYFSMLFMLFNELEDLCVRNKFTFNQDFFNHNVSWKNKWKVHQQITYDPDGFPYYGDTITPCNYRPFYYLWLYKPPYIEAFPYSSTFLVFLTDGEHLFQELKLLMVCFIGAVSFDIFMPNSLSVSVFIPSIYPLLPSNTSPTLLAFLSCFIGIKLTGFFKEVISSTLNISLD